MPDGFGSKEPVRCGVRDPIDARIDANGQIRKYAAIGRQRRSPCKADLAAARGVEKRSWFLPVETYEPTRVAPTPQTRRAVSLVGSTATP